MESAQLRAASGFVPHCTVISAKLKPALINLAMGHGIISVSMKIGFFRALKPIESDKCVTLSRIC
jgi:hypothetical protein